MNKRFYDVCATIAAPFFAVLHPSRAHGMENVPADGGFILCSNHMSNRDVILLALTFRKTRRITYLGKVELFANPLLKRLLGESGFGMIAIKRGESDLAAVRACLKTVADGDVLGIFPQGTRSRGNVRTPMLTGVALIAARAKAPVIPVYIDGPYRLFRRTDVFVGQPVQLDDLGRKMDAETLQKITDRIDDAVWSLKR